jgi:HEAT repeat protein
VRLAATESLGRLRLPAGFRVLQAALSDSSDWVKLAARAALDEVAVPAA